MAANYFMLTKGGLAGIDCPPLPGLTSAGSSWGLSNIEFTDTFASGLGAWWTTSFGGGFDPAVVSGRLRMATPAAVTGEAYVGRDFTQTWEDVTVTAEVAPTAFNGPQYMEMQLLWSLYTGYLTMYIEGGHLKAQILQGTAEDLGTYNPASDRWWRVAEKAGVFTFSTSPDGATWDRAEHPVAHLPFGGGRSRQHLVPHDQRRERGDGDLHRQALMGRR